MWSLPCLSDVNVAVKRLEDDFRSTTIDISCDTFVNLDTEFAALGPFVFDYRGVCGRCRLNIKITVNLSVVGVNLHRGFEICRKGHINVSVE